MFSTTINILRRTTRLAPLAAMSAMSLLSSLTAQDMTASVSADPRAGTATYDFHFDGPPRGFAVLFVTQSLLPKPIDLGPIGTWELEVPGLPLVTLPMSSTGKAAFRLTLPIRVAPQLSFQPLFIDAQLTLRLTPAWSFYALQNDGPQMAGADAASFSWSSRSKVVKFSVQQCKKGDHIEVRVNGRVMCQFVARQDGVRSNWFKHNNPCATGTKIEVRKNGKLWFKNPAVSRR